MYRIEQIGATTRRVESPMSRRSGRGQQRQRKGHQHCRVSTGSAQYVQVVGSHA